MLNETISVIFKHREIFFFLTWEIRRLLRLQWRLYWRSWRITVRLTFSNTIRGLCLRSRISGLNWGRGCRRFFGGRFFLVRIIDDVPSTASKRNRGHDFHHFEAVGGTVGRVRQRNFVPEKLKKNSSKRIKTTFFGFIPRWFGEKKRENSIM